MIPHIVRIKILDSTTHTDLHDYFTTTWTLGQRVKLVLDTCDCKNIGLRRILSMAGVLNNHRANSKQYVISSTILVNSILAHSLLVIGLTIIRSEKPIEILLVQ